MQYFEAADSQGNSVATDRRKEALELRGYVDIRECWDGAMNQEAIEEAIDDVVDYYVKSMNRVTRFESQLGT